MEKSLNDNLFGYIDENLKYIYNNINEACIKSGRSFDEVTLMAVTKTVDTARINYAISKGIKIIGENKVQEFLEKEDSLKTQDCTSCLIGHLQSNKVRKIVGHVDMIQSVDSIELAKEISKRSIENNITTQILLQINGGEEENKFGFTLDEIYEKSCEISEIPNIKIQGLMCVAPICENNSDIYKIFNNINNKFIDIRDKNIDNISMNVLSMGMSGDYEEAIKAGSTMVRIGSAIFGNRNYR